MATLIIKDNLESFVDKMTNLVAEEMHDYIDEHWSKTKALPGDPPGIDSGDLRASIKSKVKIADDEDIITISTDLDYAQYLEFGTSQMPAHPFLRPALNKAYDFTVEVGKNKL
jgi:HK97 gp10 family phage protein